MDKDNANPNTKVSKVNVIVSVAYILLTSIGIFIVGSYLQKQGSPKKIPYSEFLEDLQSGKVASVMLNNSMLTGEFKGSKTGEHAATFLTVPLDDPGLVDKLRAARVTFAREASSPFLNSLLSWLAPLLLFYLIWGFVLRRAGGGMKGGLLSLTKSKVRVYVERDVKTTFADVAGVDEAKEELQEVVAFLKEPQRYARLGGRIPKGVLLVGPPGTGKTLLARAIAGEASVTFYSINGSEFVEMFVGLGAARIRDLFEQTRKGAPCILFIDEIDALGKSRTLGMSGIGGNDEKEQTLNQLLAELDGFDPREGIILLAATNRPEILDPALLRAGRFDRQVLIGLPDQAGRAAILAVHLRKIKASPLLDPARIAALTPGFSGAELANAVNEAALVATRRDGEDVTEADFTRAIERMVAGFEQKKRLISPLEKRRVAYHEMGHATVALTLGTAEKVHKVSIIPRSVGALGYTLRRLSEDRYLQDEDEMLATIAVLLGGRAMESITFSTISTGGADDLVKATNIARSMITSYGMSESLGLAVYEHGQPRYLTSPAYYEQHRDFSEATARLIDREVRRLLDRAYHLATQVLKDKASFIHAGAARLLDVETLDEAELMTLWDQFGRVANRAGPSDDRPKLQAPEISA